MYSNCCLCCSQAAHTNTQSQHVPACDAYTAPPGTRARFFTRQAQLVVQRGTCTRKNAAALEAVVEGQKSTWLASLAKSSNKCMSDDELQVREPHSRTVPMLYTHCMLCYSAGCCFAAMRPHSIAAGQQSWSRCAVPDQPWHRLGAGRIYSHVYVATSEPCVPCTAVASIGLQPSTASTACTGPSLPLINTSLTIDHLSLFVYVHSHKQCW